MYWIKSLSKLKIECRQNSEQYNLGWTQLRYNNLNMTIQGWLDHALIIDWRKELMKPWKTVLYIHFQLCMPVFLSNNISFLLMFSGPPNHLLRLLDIQINKTKKVKLAHLKIPGVSSLNLRPMSSSIPYQRIKSH